MNKKNIQINEWLTLSEKDRIKIHGSWDVYNGEGIHIANYVLNRFNKEKNNIGNIKIDESISIDHGGKWTITVYRPFIYDNRNKLPDHYLGIYIKILIAQNDLPNEFRIINEDKEYIWAPKRIIEFVNNHSQDIASKLGKDLTKAEMLDALSPNGDFRKWEAQCKKWEKKGIIPKYSI